MESTDVIIHMPFYFGKWDDFPIGGDGEMGLNDRGNFMDMFEKAV